MIALRGMSQLKRSLLLLVLMCAGNCVAAVESPVARQGAAPAWRALVRDFAAKNFKHPAWGFSHPERDYILARTAAKDHVSVDDDVLFAAAYLHDMAAFAPWKTDKVDHADEAALVVDTVLAATGFPVAKIEAVRDAIRTHVFDRDPAGPAAIYLHDAGALDWLGAIGVARIIALVDPNGGNGPALVSQRKAELAAFLKDLRRDPGNLGNLSAPSNRGQS